MRTCQDPYVRDLLEGVTTQKKERKRPRKRFRLRHSDFPKTAWTSVDVCHPIRVDRGQTSFFCLLCLNFELLYSAIASNLAYYLYSNNNNNKKPSSRFDRGNRRRLSPLFSFPRMIILPHSEGIGQDSGP
ncbi:uncharacterized protein BDW43DRAFT_125836 [Aspergillus alliaceus]|uniref:uncharacterized protein n=1 Tax=Petromyces alliaceus TaxID=209559 RepID=UPI0012A43132|nr:uncharacterized protein BDW43DRAFT_125836 [Aspergillus alliaceus]KAB8232112.1 hypothetical protein BDW43DRAFT_125836 [Aspergillus alliaceus]